MDFKPRAFPTLYRFYNSIRYWTQKLKLNRISNRIFLSRHCTKRLPYKAFLIYFYVILSNEGFGFSVCGVQHILQRFG